MASNPRCKSSTRKSVRRYQPYSKARQTTTPTKCDFASTLDSSLDTYEEGMLRKAPRATIVPQTGDKSRRLRDIEAALFEVSSQPAPSTSASSSSNSAASSLWTPRETVRDIVLEGIRERYPFYTPKNDWEIMCLNDGYYKGGPEGIAAYLEEELRITAGASGNRDYVHQMATQCLSAKADPTGLKPRPGDFGVFIRPLPDSDYSVRLFPGSKAASEYCLDFVLTKTGEPVNSPFEFALFAGPGATVPLGTTPTVGVKPLECSFGIPIDKIPPGKEKFLFRDGQLCTLRRPGHQDVQFTIPIRRRPELPKPDVHTLELPQFI